MSERGELAELIASNLDRLFGKREFGPAQQDIDLADSLLAAGYRKPRTITTAEELDALPVGSVVLSRGRSYQRYEPHVTQWAEYHKWMCPDGGFIRAETDSSLLLPVTVLHEAVAQ
jgi:hypothetical protein